MAPEKKYGSVEEGAEDVVPDSKPRDYKVNALRVLAGVAVVCVGLTGAAAARGASKEMELKTLPIAEAQGIWKAHSWTPKTLDDLSDPSPTKDESRIKIKGDEIHIQHADDQKFRTDSLPYSDDCHDFKINKKGQLIVEFHCVDSVDPPEEATIKYERTGPDVELSSLHQGKWTATRWSSKVGKGSDPDPFGDEKKFEIGSDKDGEFLKLFYGSQIYTDTLPYSDSCHEFSLNDLGQIVVMFFCTDTKYVNIYYEPKKSPTPQPTESPDLDVELSSLHQGIWEAAEWDFEAQAGGDPEELPDPFGAEKKLEIGIGEGANGSHHFLNLFYGYKSYTDTLPYHGSYCNDFSLNDKGQIVVKFYCTYTEATIWYEPKK